MFARYTAARRINSTLFDHTNGNSPGYSERLNGSANEVYGLARSISVMPGDVINAEVYAKYVDTNSSNWNAALTTLMSQIAANTGGIVVDGAGYATSTSSFPAGFNSYQNKTDNGAPKAYLNWLVFDRSYSFITGGFKQITTFEKETGTDVAHEYVTMPTPITITQPGYVYIYLSNENSTPVEVYFDDFTVQQIKSPVVETTDYYNAGAISSTYSRESIVPNKFKYQHKEYQDDLGLNLYDFEARQYDPWTQLTTTHDPHAESYYEWSPYIWEHDNAVRYADPTGMDPQGPGDPKPRTVNDLNPAERVVLAISLVFDKIGQVLNERNGNDNPTTNQNIVAATNFVGEVVMAGQAHMEMMQPSGGSKVASKVDDAAGQTKTVASETSSLGARAKEIHGAVSKATQGRTTIAVGEARNSEGQVVRIVGSSENRLRPAQRAMLRSNEIEATGAGHAEATVLRFAGQVDLKVGNIAASRPICQGCATAINGAGATAVTPLKKPVITTTQ